MADKIITLTIPEAKLTTALAGWLKIYPNNELVDPNDSESGNKYTNSEWVTEKIRRNVVRDVKRGLQMTANEAARVESDDEIVS